MLKEMLSVIARSWIGRIGLTLLLAMVAGSVYVGVTYPRNFGQSVWGNPEYWADNPKLAPPAKSAWGPFGKVFFWWDDSGSTRHQVLRENAPKVLQEGAGKTLSYRFHAIISPTADPDFLSFSLTNVTFWKDSPVIELYLENGNEKVFLYRYVVPGREPDEPAPASRYVDDPFHVLLTSDYSVKDEVRSFLETMRQEGKKDFIAVANVTFSDTRDSAGTARFVAGGETYGLLGTDNIGRDLWQGLLFGLPLSLIIGLSVAFFATLLGAVMGGISGYVGGKTDTIIQRFVDLLTTIPVLPILIFLIFTFGSHFSYVILFLIVFGWTGLTIQLRPWLMQIRESGFISYAQARGFSGSRIIFRHLLPQTMPFLFANFVLSVPVAILAEAGLSFLGLGDPSLPTWGYMLQQGFQTGALNDGYWWWVYPPGIAVMLTSLTFYLIYYPLEAYIEPRLRKE